MAISLARAVAGSDGVLVFDGGYDGGALSVHFQRAPIRCRADTDTTPQATRDLFHIEMLLAGFWIAPRGFMTVSLAHDDEDCDALVSEFEAFLERHGTAIEAGLK